MLRSETTPGFRYHGDVHEVTDIVERGERKPPRRLWYAELFGNVRIDYGPHPVHFRSRTAAHLIGFLLTHPRHEESRERLQALFWPDERQDDGANIFRVTLTRLRSGMSAFSDQLPVEITSSTIRVFPEAFYCDLMEFDRLLALARNEEDHRTRMGHLAKAVSFYREPLMRDCDYVWVHEARADRENKYIAALRELFCDAEARGRKADAVDYAQRILREDPYDSEMDGWIKSAHRRSSKTIKNPNIGQSKDIDELEEESLADTTDSDTLDAWIKNPAAGQLEIRVRSSRISYSYSNLIARAVEGLTRITIERNKHETPTWKTDLATHRTEFKFPDRDSKLIICVIFPNNSRPSNGLHPPLLFENQNVLGIAEDLGAEYSRYRETLRVLLQTRPPRDLQHDTLSFVRASKGQLTLTLAFLSLHGNSRIWPNDLLEQFRTFISSQISLFANTLSTSEDLRNSIGNLEPLLDANTFVTVEVADFLTQSGYTPNSVTLDPLTIKRECRDRVIIWIPSGPINQAQSQAKLSQITFNAFFQAAASRLKLSDNLLLFVSRQAKHYDGSNGIYDVDEETIFYIGAYIRRLVDIAQKMRTASHFVDWIIESVPLDRCGNATLMALFISAMSVNPSGRTINRLVTQLNRNGGDGSHLSKLAATMSKAKSRCEPPEPFNSTEPVFAAVQDKTDNPVLAYNLAISHCFYGSITDAQQYLQLAENYEGTVDQATSIASLFIKAKISERLNRHAEAAEFYRKSTVALSPLSDHRLISYTRYHEHRMRIRMKDASRFAIYDELKQCLRTGHENLIIGHLINAILTTQDIQYRSLMIGKLQHHCLESEVYTTHQFRDDLDNILSYSTEDNEIDLTMVKKGHRMANEEFAQILEQIT